VIMLTFVVTALGAVSIGWPCSRMNWAWRNVWSTCSINSYAPSTIADGGPAWGLGLRLTGTNGAPTYPYQMLNTAGVFGPTTGATGQTTLAGTNGPMFFCNNMMATGATGVPATSILRNRCRRAIDAYGALVLNCNTPRSAGLTSASGGTPDYVPNTGHAPHYQNVAGLTSAAQFCYLNVAGVTQVGMPNLRTPSNTCPGLLGWFTVVFNSCGFTNIPALAPNQNGNFDADMALPLGGVVTPWVLSSSTTVGSSVIGSATLNPTMGGYFCNTPVGTGTHYNAAPVINPVSWNDMRYIGGSAVPYASTFRTSRCRKALDQFGRQAMRCHTSTAAMPAGPAQAGGYSDVLRYLAVGAVGAAGPVSPMGMNIWAPICNNII